MNILKRICPICAVVSLTWVTMLAFKWQGYRVDDELLAILMGGSAVGISYVLGTRITVHGGSAKWWKFVAIPIGFAAMYALLQFAWGYAFAAMLAYGIVWVFFRNASAPPDGARIDAITKELDNCCD